MFLQEDDLSKFEFMSIKDFLFALFLIFLATIFSFIYVPFILQKLLPYYKNLITSHYFGIIIFFISSILSTYIIYYFSCKKQKKTLRDGLFLYKKTTKVNLLSILIGIIMPLVTLPVIFKFAPHEFYAMDLARTKEGLFYLFSAALLAPVFEELFYRGFIFPFFQSKLNSFWAVIVTSLFFGFSHMFNIGGAYVLLSIFILYGFVLTLIRYFTNSLIPPIITHFIHNVTLIISFIIASNLQG